ncbi:MAG: universal stress protein [Chlamydiales bacterium]|jgi:APA family basic amino acid/polyamine antiporter|nr:universal stress protein [Chlamydiales bacterium]
MQKGSGLKQTIAQLHKNTFKRVLGVFELFAIGYGDLGSSIYYALGVTALFALGATPIALGLAGIVFICTALSYAEMTSIFHESGGSASYARHAFNDLVSFIAGWGLLLDYIVAIAISAFAVAPYLNFFFVDLSDVFVQVLFTAALITLLCVINILGVKGSTLIGLVLSSLTILIQLAIIAVGLDTILNLTRFTQQLQIGIPFVDWSASWPNFWKGTAMAMVAFTGIESIAQLSAEAERPAKTIPRAILLAMVVLIVVYTGILLVTFSAVPPRELGTTYLSNPFAAIVNALPFGHWFFAPIVAGLAAAVLIGAANANLLGASRLSFNLSQHYQLPRLFHRIHPRLRTPIVPLIFFSVLACIVVFSSKGKMDFLADLYNFGAMIAFFFTHLSLLVLRIKKPDIQRSFRVPLNLRIQNYFIPIPSIIGALSTLGVWCLIVFTKPEGRYLGSVWMVLGVAMYFYYRKKRKLKPAGQLVIEEVFVPSYKPLKIKQILVATRGGIQTETVQVACDLAKLHGAEITALQVIEIASSLPLDMMVPRRLAMAEAVLKRAEAIARERNVDIELMVVSSRSIPEAILETARKGRYDLIVIGAGQPFDEIGLGAVIGKVLRLAPCRVWVCTTQSLVQVTRDEMT